jgi:UDP-N-acetylmuramate dehydrogenase
VRAAVLALRRRKSMVIDPADENRRSAGSFFMNPIVAAALAEEVVRQALREGLVADAAQVPRYPAPDGQVKLAAGWLIERAGIARGHRRGPVGVSSRHALALVHHGAGRTADLLALAREVRDAVAARFGVRLVPEPVLLGTALDAP